MKISGRLVSSDKLIVISAVLMGLAIRILFRDHTTSDTYDYLLPWYQQALSDGIGSLRDGLTNYAPFYSYLLILATRLDGLAPPLLLIKSISFLFELGSALIVWRLVGLLGGSAVRSALAFAATWLAPSVLFNGALWGQANSIWTFFIVLSVLLICTGRDRLAVLAFSVSVSVKLLGSFFGPVILALVLKRRLHWIWLALPPAVYLALALPVLVAGRPLGDVLLIYAEQAEFFHQLAKNAPNLWLFVPARFYTVGLWIGLPIGLLAALFLSRTIAKRPWSREFVIFASATSLLLMPWVLPKMHERYFYGFEILLIPLAFLAPRLAPIAIAAQIAALLSYLTFDGVAGLAVLGVPLAAMINTASVCYAIRACVDGRFNSASYAATIGVVVATFVIWVIAIRALIDPARSLEWWPQDRYDPIGLAMYAALTMVALVPILRYIGGSKPGRCTTHFEITKTSETDSAAAAH